MLRFFFPSFEKPVPRPRYLNIEPEGHDFHGVGVVLLLAASCGVALALWEPSHRVTSPFVTASVSRSAPAGASDAKIASQETNAAADAEDDQPPTVKLSAFCSQRATARRACAEVKAFKEARLKAPDPAAAPSDPAAAPSDPAAAPSKQAQPAVVAAKAAVADQPETAAVAAQPEKPTVQPQRTAAAPKAKRARPPVEEAPVERLVRVYDQIMPDGRRVPVYRRVGSGRYETGIIVDGEYRPSRRANLGPPTGRYFGLQ